MFRSDIEGLRGIAVLSIVAFHAGISGFRGGFIGVDIFFVLSGYLITRLLVNEIDESDGIDLPRFYARRARRLLPGLALMITVITAVALIVLPPLEQKTLSGTALAAWAYCSNFVLMAQASDYFGPLAHANPLLNTWSLGVEEQFYLVWPLLILLGYTNRRSRNLVAVIAILWRSRLRRASGSHTDGHSGDSTVCPHALGSLELEGSSASCQAPGSPSTAVSCAC